jgi:hypothetical protein
LRVTVQSHPSGHRRVEILHASDAAGRERTVTLSDQPIGFDPAPLAEVARQLEAVEKDLASFVGNSPDRAAVEAKALKLRAELVAPRWNQVARVGQFRGHPAGAFELNPAVFDQIVRNYREVDKGAVGIDFEHASEADESSGTIPVTGAPLQGRILDLENRGQDGLWGLCEFFEPALTYVREGRYPFFSPAIRFGAKHPETAQPIGARLTSVALVTRPFLRGLQPLAARDPAAPGATTMSLPSTHHEMMKSLKACMKLPDIATGADMKDHLGKLREHAKAILDKPAIHATGHYSAGGVHCGDYIPQLAEAINAPAHMPVSEILDAVEEMIDAAIERHVEEMHMSDVTPTTDDPAALAEALGKTKEQLRMRDGEARSLATEKSALSLSLKDEQAARAAAEQKLATVEAELKTLRDADAQRLEQAIVDRVEEAFATYKDARKLTDDDKGDMMILARADFERFHKRYPRLAGKEYLLRNLTTTRTPVGAPPVTAPGPGPSAPGQAALSLADQAKLCDKLVSEHKMSREAATSYAFQVATGQRAMPQLGA